MSPDYQRKTGNGFNKMADSYAIAQPMCDWLRLTSWDYEVFVHFMSLITANAAMKGKSSYETTWLGYDGTEVNMLGGSVFAGTKIQKGKEHYMIQGSGESGHHLLSHYQGIIERGLNVACTRLDIQVTVPRPPTWNQFELLHYVKHETRYTGTYDESPYEFGGTLATVYAGAKSSDNYARIYEKASRESGVFLRFEIEYKGDRSRIAGPMVARERRAIGSLLQGKLSNINYPPLTILFHQSLANYEPETVRLQRVYEEDKTRSWLLGNCLPAFARYINSHGADPFVAEQFYNALEWASENWVQ